ncbi:MAG: asparagine synthase (glutamine-hydrolyzing) [Methanoregula sp.]|nr:asparagine synthase (glutamine-hydrolyzing) [Methanoregula sp.]
MCGINGFNWADLDLIKKMNSVTKNRGPDDEGKYIDNFVSLGHSRLSIIDLSPKGHQPMSNEDETIWLTYNGEIYNFNEIRQDLIKAGHIFKSHTDSEVIIHAYEQFGIDCLSRFNGMWAFCIYDKNREQLILSRDRFGVKPLYYHLSDGKIIFSSMISSILSHPLKRQQEISVIMEFLAFNLINHDKRTFFKDILSLEPGSYLIFDLTSKDVQIKQWYQLKQHPTVTAQELTALFIQSVKSRTVSDVPIGSCLSGGIDSSAIVCTLDTMINQPFFTYSLIFPGKKIDESRYMKEVGKFTKIQQQFTTLNVNDFLHDLRDFIKAQEEPTTGLSAYGQYCIMKLAYENKAKVLLDGQGGDEIFAGYTYYFAYYYYELLKKGHILALIKEMRSYHKNLKDYYPQLFLCFILLPAKIQNYLYKNYLLKWLNFDLLQESAVNKRDPRCKPMALHDSLVLTLLYTAIPHLLRHEDKNSMRWSIETRVPFLDFNLVESAMSIPTTDKIQNGKTKIIFKEAIKNLIPDMILHRKDKIGFETPVDEFFRDPQIVEFCNTIFTSEQFKSRPFWNWKEIERQFTRHREGKSNIGDTIWKWINLEIWMREFFDDDTLVGAFSQQGHSGKRP